MREITPTELKRLQDLIRAGNEDQFYSWRIWRNHVRPEILKLDRYECQLCKARGKYARAEIVHHVKHLRDAPGLALSAYDPNTGSRQLISVCKSCHEAEHPESLQAFGSMQQQPPITPERWD